MYEEAWDRGERQGREKEGGEVLGTGVRGEDGGGGMKVVVCMFACLGSCVYLWRICSMGSLEILFEIGKCS